MEQDLMSERSELPVFVPAYDTEHTGGCLEACREIVRVHREHNVPATFFIVGRLLEEEGREYRELLGASGLFEVASHTYSHRLFLDHPVCGKGADLEQIHTEIVEGKRLVEDVFERPCVGLRPGCGFETGFRGASGVVAELAAAGLRYVSSQLWGPHSTVPAPLEQAYTYADEGAPGLWEFPGHGWHENVLKGHNATPGRLLLWPPFYPDALMTGYVKTPREEFEVHRFFVDRAIRDRREYVSLVWHPWSLGKFDPDMAMLEQLFGYVAEQGMGFARFCDLRERRCS